MTIKIPIQEIEKKLKYKFKKKKLINDCFIHPSFLKKNKKFNNNFVHEFERLEFLGDRVLGIIIASLIFNKFVDYDEGTLSKKFSLLVQRDFLYKMALTLNLNDFVKVNNKNFNLKSQKSILSDTLIWQLRRECGCLSGFRLSIASSVLSGDPTFSIHVGSIIT